MTAEREDWQDWSTMGEARNLVEAASQMSDEELAKIIESFDRTIARLIEDRDSLLAIQRARFETYRRDVDMPTEEIKAAN